MTSTEAPVGRHQIIGQRLIGGFLIIALGLGGAGTAYPLLEALIRLMALSVVLWVCVGPQRVLWRGSASAVLCLVAALVLLIVAQIIPLPPSVWHHLPYHAIAEQVDAAAGFDVWRSLSLTPDATGAALPALLPPMAGWLAFMAITGRDRRKLLMQVGLMAVLSASLGLLQAGERDVDGLFPFKTMHRDFGIGLFVNRNHQACFLLMVMPLVLALARLTRRTLWRWAGLAAIILLGLGVIATESRTGLFLLPVVGLAMAFQAGILQSRLKLAAVVLAAAVAIPLLWISPMVQITLHRLSASADDGRFDYWGNTQHVLPDVLPWGAGLGSFRQVYASIEPLGEVGHLFVEHAHDDYLEWLVEAGWPGVAVLAGLLLAIGFGYRQTLRLHVAGSERRALAHAGLIGSLVLIACSLTDYPVRMPALAMLGGVLLALIMPAPVVLARESRGLFRVVGGLAGGVLAIPVILIGVGEHNLLTGNSALAVRLMPWSARAWSARAADQLTARDGAGAAASATLALRAEAMNPDALSALARAYVMQNQQERAGALLLVAAQLGWRDAVVQVWLVDQGVRQGRYDIALRSMDALLRMGALADPFYALMRDMAHQEQGRPALVEVLATRPPWRQGFINILAPDAVDQFADIDALLNDLARAGAGSDERETALMRWAAMAAGHYADVARLWSLAGEKGVIGHPAFDLPLAPLPTQAAPMNWFASPLPGANVNLVQQNGASVANGVAISSDGIATGPVLAQRLVLTPGAYRVALDMRAQDGGADVMPGIRITCESHDAEGLTQEPGLVWSKGANGADKANAAFRIDEGCPSQKLGFILNSSQGRPLAYSVMAIRVERVPTGDARAN